MRQRFLVKVLVAMLALSTTAGCTTEPRKNRYQRITEVPNYDVAPQVLYRIDDHRFISLENYDRCYGDAYYNDTRQGIRHGIGRGSGIETFAGRLIIDDPTGMNVVIPLAPAWSCGDRGCNVSLIYSTDAGQTFRYLKYMNSFRPPKDSENYTFAVTKDAFYVIEKMQYDAYVRKYPLVKDIDLNKPYPPGLHDQTSWASKKPLPASLRTPSGQERFTCDKSIRPANLPKQ